MDVLPQNWLIVSVFLAMSMLQIKQKQVFVPLIRQLAHCQYLIFSGMERRVATLSSHSQSHSYNKQ
jgi:hypothetical protein